MTDNIFNGDNQAEPPVSNGDNNTSWLDKIAADKGDKFRDPEELAKSLFNANLHIKTLEEENQKSKDAQSKADYAKELLETLRNQQPAAGDSAQPKINSGGDDGATTSFGPEDIKKLVEEAVLGRERNQTREQNIAEASRIMSERFGTEASRELDKRSQELGINKSDLEEMAAKSPTAFLRLLGEAPAAQTNSTPTNSTNTANLTSNSGNRDWAYYSKLRKENPKMYRTASIQNQMEADYAQQGEKFWGR